MHPSDEYYITFFIIIKYSNEGLVLLLIQLLLLAYV